MLKVSVILLAGGTGSRMGAKIPKQYLMLAGKPIARHSFDTFLKLDQVKEIIIVCTPESQSHFQVETTKRIVFALPGIRRQDSVYNGFLKISNEADLVCVHDSARPLVSLETIKNVIQGASEHGAATAAMPVSFTVKLGNEQGFVDKTLNRSLLWEIQTPQAMYPRLLQQGFAIANEQQITVTDCASLIELASHPVKLVQGNTSNLKITHPFDHKIAETLLN